MTEAWRLSYAIRPEKLHLFNLGKGKEICDHTQLDESGKETRDKLFQFE